MGSDYRSEGQSDPGCPAEIVVAGGWTAGRSETRGYPDAGLYDPESGLIVTGVETSLETLLGSRTAEKVLLYLVHHGEAYPNGAARDLGISLGAVQRQLDRFEGAGFLISRLLGRTRIYTFNPKHPATAPLLELLEFYYEAILLSGREAVFRTRRRPRRRGKPVLRS